MKTLFTLAAFGFSGLIFADTLTLRNGDQVEGTYLGGTTRVLRMEVNGEVQTFDIGMVTNLQFSVPSGASAAAPPPVNNTPPPPVRASSRPAPSYPDSSYPSSSDRPVLKRAPNSDGDSVSGSSSSSSSNIPPAQPMN